MSRRQIPVLITAVLAVFLWASTPATAQQSCADRASVIKHLAGKYSETPIAAGLSHSGGVIEVLASRNGASWTIIITLPSGVSCPVAAGETWQILAPKPAQEPDA